MGTLLEFLRAEQLENNAWRFHVPRELHGAFGGAFGGVVAAATIVTARSVAEGRTPNALDCRFVRGLRAGDATATATVINSGRTLSTVSVDLADEEGKLCTRATVSLVDPAVLYDHRTSNAVAGDWMPHADAAKWPAVAPIVEAIDSRIVGEDERGIATAVRVPWDVDPSTSAEAACIAADMSVGPPVGGAVPRGVSSPNPDISLRFCGEVTTDILVGACRIDRAFGGIAA
ncbi:MAG: acyl-CoA thioesterase domain-containing protein, partial [Actinomycetota bacterium]